MAAGPEIVSFDDVIQADRQRRKNEALAQQIFGKNRRASTPSNGVRKPGTGPSLASRVGITKRSASSTPRPKITGNPNGRHDLQQAHSPRNPPARSPALSNPMGRTPRNDRRNKRLQEALQNVSINGASEGFSIRGLAGPYVVMGSNFAPGTTAADIESAMVPTVGEMQSCKIMTSTPTVIAEMVFADKGSADNVISTFNNKKADGRILHIYMKHGAATSTPVAPASKPPATPEVDLSRNEPSYDSQREQYDRNRRRADPEFQDGSYGFESKSDQMDVDTDVRRDDWQDGRREGGRGRDNGRDNGRGNNYRPLYSDDLYPRPRGRGFR